MLCHTRMKLPDLQVFLWLCLLNFGMVVSIIEPGYLDFDNLPDTNFSCVGKVIGGYYADLETSCQMFHVCTIGQLEEPMDIRFLCLNGTVFDQETRVCERVDEVDCSKSEKFYHLNLELYGNTAPPIVEEPEPVLPSKQSVSSTTLRSTTTQPSKRTTYSSPTTTHSAPKVVDSHQYPVNSGPDIRFNPEEINIRLTPGNPPIINAPSILPFLQSYSESQVVATTPRSGYKDVDRVENAQVTPTPKVVSYGLKHTSKNYQNYDYSYQHTDNPSVDYNTDIPASGYDYHEPGRYGHSDNFDNQKVQYGPTVKSSQQNVPSSTLSIKHQVSSTIKPLIQTPQVPTLPPLIFSSPAPFSLLRHVEQKRSNKHHTPPRVIVSASASVSDASGKRLNYSLGTIGTSHIIGTAPSSYDDYKEDDVGLDPFYHDVPKVNTKHSIKKRDVEQIGEHNETHWVPPDYVDDNYEPITYEKEKNDTKVVEETKVVTPKYVNHKPKVIVHNIDDSVLTMLLNTIIQNIKNATRSVGKKTNKTENETFLKDETKYNQEKTIESGLLNDTGDQNDQIVQYSTPISNGEESSIYKTTAVPIAPTEPTTVATNSLDNATVFNLEDRIEDYDEEVENYHSNYGKETTTQYLSTLGEDNIENAPTTVSYTTEKNLLDQLFSNMNNTQEEVELRILEEADNGNLEKNTTTDVLNTEEYRSTTENSILNIDDGTEYANQQIGNDTPIMERRIFQELDNSKTVSEESTTQAYNTEEYKPTTENSIHKNEDDIDLNEQISNNTPILEGRMFKGLDNFKISEQDTTTQEEYKSTTENPKFNIYEDENASQEISKDYNTPILEELDSFKGISEDTTTQVYSTEVHQTTENIFDRTTELSQQSTSGNLDHSTEGPVENDGTNVDGSTDLSNSTEYDSITTGSDLNPTTDETTLSSDLSTISTMVPFDATTVLIEELTKSSLNIYDPKSIDTSLETSHAASLSTESVQSLTTVATTDSQPVSPKTLSSTTRYSYLRTRAPLWKTNRRTRPTARHRFSSPAISMSSSVLKLKGLITTVPNKKIVTDSYLSKSVYPTEETNELSSTTPIAKPVLKKSSSFNCIDKKMDVFYADPRDCRLFHYCTPGFNKKQVLDMRFVCDSGTYFDIDKLICSKNLPVRCK